MTNGIYIVYTFLHMKILPDPIQFEWDKGNIDKNWKKHRVTNAEAEEVFTNQPLVYSDLKHSQLEKRFDCLGENNNKRKLFISFTIRKNNIRIISARNMNTKEKKYMKKQFKILPIFKNEDEEREFWSTHDSTDYIDWSKAERVIFPNLKLTKRPISLRINEGLLNKVKVIANKKDVPYQTLMKQYILEAADKEYRRLIA